MTFYEAAQLAKEAEVKEMWLTHYSPSLTKPEEYMDDVKAIFQNSIAAKDKRSVELVFEDQEGKYERDKRCINTGNRKLL